MAPSSRTAASVCCFALSAAVAVAAPQVAVDRGDDSSLRVKLLRDAATATINGLYETYNASSGEFGPASAIPFWTTANAIEVLAHASVVVPVTAQQFYATLDNTVANSWVGSGQQGDFFHDDQLWWAIAFLRVHAITGNATYLSYAVTTFTALSGPWESWNATCGGYTWGGKHVKGGGYRNSITNELAATAAALLSAALPTAVVNGLTYSQHGERVLNWLASTPLLQPNGLYQDGLSQTAPTCSVVAQGGKEWTYNSAVVLGALAEFDAAPWAAGKQLAAQGAALIDAALAEWAGSGDSVLRELSCSPTGDCGNGADGHQFKGVLVRYMGKYRRVLAQATADPAGTLARWNAAITANADSIVANATPGPNGGSLVLPQLWQGPAGVNPIPWVDQSAGLEALLAALEVAQEAEGI